MNKEELINHLESLNADLKVAAKPAEAMILRVAIIALGTGNVAETADLLWRIVHLVAQLELLKLQNESAFEKGKSEGLREAVQAVQDEFLGPAPTWPDRVD